MSLTRPLFFGVAFCLGLFFTGTAGYSGQTADTSAPSGTAVENQSEAKPVDSSGDKEAAATAEAVDPVYQFDPVLDGETVTHTFVIKNTGTAELKVLKVRTG